VHYPLKLHAVRDEAASNSQIKESPMTTKAEFALVEDLTVEETRNIIPIELSLGDLDLIGGGGTIEVFG
jgi:hypothetical protein